MPEILQDRRPDTERDIVTATVNDMIISASRRTDIPAFYSEWLISRLRDGYVLVRDPYNANRLKRIGLTPENVDCIVLWTKDPSAMTERFEQLDKMGYHYYVQFTLTPYGKDIEPHLPPKNELIRTFRRMSEMIGVTRSVWRYDPVIISDKHPVDWHIERFAEMCGLLQDHTERCFVSFIDMYRNIDKIFRPMTEDEMRTTASGFSKVAKEHDITVFTCSESIDLSGYGIKHGACIDRELIERITGHRINAEKDANQRNECGCAESADIGSYNTCAHGCSYCYATSNRSTALRRTASHDPDSPIIYGRPNGNETVTDVTKRSHRNTQQSLSEYE